MPTQDIIQQQNEIIQRSLSIINDDERGKSEAVLRLLVVILATSIST